MRTTIRRAATVVAILCGALAGQQAASQTPKGPDAPGGAVHGQDRAPGLTGADRADDVMQARQLVMDGIDAEMGPIDLAGAGTTAPLDQLKAHAERINVLLTAFPHLFPPQTRPPADGSQGATAAAMAIWENFDDFYGLSQAAATTAFDASRAETADKFRDLGKTLRAGCDGCHAKYMHVDPPPRP